MKKLYIFVLLSACAGKVCAEAPDLSTIKSAITEGDLARVKRLWKSIGRKHTIEERKNALDELFDVAKESIDNKQDTTSGGHNYKRLVGGGLLYATGLTALGAHLYVGHQNDWRISRDDAPLYYGLLVGGAVLNTAGYYLFRSGWNTQAQAGGGKSSARAIEIYLDDELEELEDEAAEEI